MFEDSILGTGDHSAEKRTLSLVYLLLPLCYQKMSLCLSRQKKEMREEKRAIKPLDLQNYLIKNTQNKAKLIMKPRMRETSTPAPNSDIPVENHLNIVLNFPFVAFSATLSLNVFIPSINGTHFSSSLVSGKTIIA